MTALEIPDTRTVVGEFAFAIVIKEDGDIGCEWGIEDLEKEQVIGYLDVILDRLREEVRLGWDTCPGCGKPWSEHDVEDDEEE